MAFRFGDPGGRSYNTIGAGGANILAWWNGGSNSVASAFSITSGGGRSGGNAIRNSANSSVYVTKVLDSQPTWGIAFALKVNVFQITAPHQFFALYDGISMQLDFRVNVDGSIFITRNGTTLGTASVSLSTSVWTHIEWLSTIHNTAGTTQVWLNGISILNLTSQNTRNTVNNSANTILFGNSLSGAGGSPSFDHDDIIIYDGQTIDPQGNPDIHGQIGDCGLVWLLPTADGTTTQFTPSGGGNNYSNVDDATPDGDGTYVEDATIGHIDTYQLANLPGNIATVKSMGVVSYVRKSDISARGMKHEIRTNSTNVVHTNEISLPDSYTYFMSTWGSNPTGTPAAWSVTDINNLEIGRQVSS